MVGIPLDEQSFRMESKIIYKKNKIIDKKYL